MNRTHYIYNIALLLLLGAATPLAAQTIRGKIYGGGQLATVDGDTNVQINSGKIGDGEAFDGGVFGGGLGEPTIVTGNVKVLIGKDGSDKDATGATINGDVYGGSALGNTNCSADKNATPNKTTNVTLNAGTINGSMYGGALGQKNGMGGADKDVVANVYGPVVVTTNGGKVSTTKIAGSGSVFGCNNVNGAPQNTVEVNIKNTSSAEDAITNVYGGGNMAAYVAPTDYQAPNKGTSPAVTISGGNIKDDVFGGGLSAAVTGNTLVLVEGGTVHRNVYGGGALADVTGNTTVNLFGGAVGGAYGGALGQLASVAVGTEGSDDYVPAKDAIAAHVDGNTTVTLGKGVGAPDENTGYYSEYTASQVTGDGIFGCNNINGTPTGHAFVHVLKTVTRSTNFGDGKKRNEPNAPDSYDVPAVYGGGNLSAYEPDLTEETGNPKQFAEVLIENCDNSIAYVYGGGNAAPVPATKVTIMGANAIDHAFAGGNGAGQNTDPSAANYNPGADVGYLGYYSKGSATVYGTGKASVTVYGGTVHNIYGGSNTLGYIRGGTEVGVAAVPDSYKGPRCLLDVGNVFGGGNKADINCDVTINCGCSEGADVIYAGASNADVGGGITLNINSGTYGKVFCGNNTGGAIKGKLTLNVDETGCWPVMIGELYGGGNRAAYSVRGWNSDGKARTEDQFNALTEEEKAAENFKEGKPYGDLEINLISFTRIGKVFGGGYGESAVIYGNTNVNVNPIKGSFAGETVVPPFILDGNDERIELSKATTLPYGITWGENHSIVIPNEAGSIGTIYGGGNAGAVYGNTNVLIGTGTKFKTADNKVANKHMNADESDAAEEVAVTITGNVFGGGNEAIVSGNTDVKIGEE